MTPRLLCDFTVASCVEDGGLIKLALTEEGEIVTLSKISMPCPMYHLREGKRLYAVLRAPFADSAESGIITVDEESGELIPPVRKSGGRVGCHISLLDGEPLIANYSSASVLGAGGELIRHTGSSINERRQSEPHPHFVMPTPNGKYFAVCDLGLDKVLLYDRQNRLLSEAKLPAGTGPRHLCFDEARGKAYVICEMGGCICTLALDEEAGKLSYLSTLALAQKVDYPLSGAAIKLSADGTRLYATERKTEKIYTLAVSDEGLKIIGESDTDGKEPRDFALIDGGYAVVCNQFSDSVVVYKLDRDGIPQRLAKTTVKGALCVI